jgi:transcriptional regulator with XRE-family HTH domain
MSALSRVSGVRVGQICKYEQGDAAPTPATIAKLASTLGVAADVLIDGPLPEGCPVDIPAPDPLPGPAAKYCKSIIIITYNPGRHDKPFGTDAKAADAYVTRKRQMGVMVIDRLERWEQL